MKEIETDKFPIAESRLELMLKPELSRDATPEEALALTLINRGNGVGVEVGPSENPGFVEVRLWERNGENR